MNIDNFKDHIDEKILNRGYDYYIDGNIIEVYTEDELEYIFQIQGSEDYEVVVNINKNKEIISSICDCPYDFGPICKHQVAAYFELKSTLNETKKKKVAKKKKPIKEILNNLSKEELINLLLEITNKDKNLKNNIIFRYSECDETQELNKCRQFMKSIVNKHTRKYNFIQYNDTYKFIEELQPLLDKVNYTNNTILSIDIATMLLSECIEAFQYADDSNGEIGSFADEIIYSIKDKVIQSKVGDDYLNEALFNKLLNYTDSKVFDGYEDYKISILDICVEFSNIEKLRNELMEKIESLINTKNDSMYDKYFNEAILKIMFYIIYKYKTKEEVETFIEKNIEYTSFRKYLIEKYIEEGNYKKVIDIALEGECKDKEYAGLLIFWKEIRYNAYKQLCLKDKQRELAKELLFNGDFKYYKELKALDESNDNLFYENLKQELKHGSYRSKGVYLKLIEAENDLDEIMEVVRKSHINIEQYAKILINKFEDEVTKIYQDYIREQARIATDRKAYNRVCKIIKRYLDITSYEKQEYIINELQNLYNKRPAFLDELSKIKNSR
ncbi:MAG: hypothetical protein RSF67_06690 [Clostridia bacterium]